MTVKKQNFKCILNRGASNELNSVTYYANSVWILDTEFVAMEAPRLATADSHYERCLNRIYRACRFVSQSPVPFSQYRNEMHSLQAELSQCLVFSDYVFEFAGTVQSCHWRGSFYFNRLLDYLSLSDDVHAIKMILLELAATLKLLKDNPHRASLSCREVHEKMVSIRPGYPGISSEDVDAWHKIPSTEQQTDLVGVKVINMLERIKPKV